MSSTHPPTCGNRSLTGVPDCPFGSNFQGDASTLPTLLNCVGSTLAWIARPCSRRSRGLGSNVSTCDGPPSMNRKMTFFALAGKCVGRGAIGSGLDPSPGPETRFAPYAFSPIRAARATAPKPLAHRESIWRRPIGLSMKRPQCIGSPRGPNTRPGREEIGAGTSRTAKRRGRSAADAGRMISGDRHELLDVEQDVGEVGPGLRGVAADRDELCGGRALVVAGRAAECLAIHPVDRVG